MYRFIHAEKANFKVAFSCRVLCVSRSAYYRWESGCISKRSKEDRKLQLEIKIIHKEHKGRYGSPRIHRELRARGFRTSRKRVLRLMGAEGISGRIPRRFKNTTDSKHSKRMEPNLLDRNFVVDEPNKSWVGDVTYIPTLDGWLYLATLIDLCSRRIVGWAMSDAIDTQLVLKALDMALKNRKPGPGLMHHTDRDCRYASDKYREVLKERGIVVSMSRKANCWDNAVAESFFATLEKELLEGENLLPRYETRLCVADYIEDYYNCKRRHSHIDYETPLEYEMRTAA